MRRSVRPEEETKEGVKEWKEKEKGRLNVGCMDVKRLDRMVDRSSALLWEGRRQHT